MYVQPDLSINSLNQNFNEKISVKHTSLKPWSIYIYIYIYMSILVALTTIPQSLYVTRHLYCIAATPTV